MTSRASSRSARRREVGIDGDASHRAGAPRFRRRPRRRRILRRLALRAGHRAWRLPPITSCATRRHLPKRCRRLRPPPRKAPSSPSASSRRSRPPATAISARAPRWARMACGRSPPSWRSRTRRAAERYVARRLHLWNSGNFLFCAATFLDELERLAPEIAAAARAPSRRPSPISASSASTRRASPPPPKISIDYAVMEKTDRAAVVPAASAGRTSAPGTRSRDQRARTRPATGREGPVEAIDAKGCLVRSDGPVVGAVGIENIVVVATADAVLVADRDACRGREGSGGAFAPRQRARGRRSTRRITAPWGSYRVDRPRRALPGQAHRRRAGREAVAAEAHPPRRALGRRPRHRRGHHRRRGQFLSPRTSPSTSRSAPRTAWRIRARSRSSSSRSRPAATSGKTTSSGSRTSPVSEWRA